jgi:sugar phosphate isomerase/epimerase
MPADASTGAQSQRPAGPFRYCLNTSTIRGQKLPVTEVIDIAAKAGYQGIEPWINELDAHVKAGGTLADLRKRIADHGLKVESAIGFPEWIVNDDARRARGLDQARRDMEMVAQIGGAYIAAPASGAQEATDISLPAAAERYRALCELGEKMGVSPQVEVWGFSKTLTRLSDAAFVAIQANHPRACILADSYHLHRGGSGFEGLKQLNGAQMHCFHINDYPADPPAPQLTDAHRVYPGDGAAPLVQVLRTLRDIGFRGALSLELFNKNYWAQDPLAVARTGLDKVKAVVAKAISTV